MNKKIYDNYVYMAICEATLEMYKITKFPTHFGYCRTIKLCLMDERISVQDNYKKIKNVILALENLFSMDPKIMGEYIMDYFIQEKFLIFEKPVLAMKAFYPNSSIVDTKYYQ